MQSQVLAGPAADPFVSFVWFVVESLRRFRAPLMSDFTTKDTKVTKKSAPSAQAPSCPLCPLWSNTDEEAGSGLTAKDAKEVCAGGRYRSRALGAHSQPAN
jgi:hypothetical protein